MTKASGSSDVRELIVDNIPSLRAFARALANDRDRADDLVQETIVKALSNLDRFQTGTNIRAWLFTILRNSFFSELRKQRREVADVDGKYAAQLTTRATQIDAVEFRDFRRALLKLPKRAAGGADPRRTGGIFLRGSRRHIRLRRRYDQESRQPGAYPSDRND